MAGIRVSSCNIKSLLTGVSSPWYSVVMLSLTTFQTGTRDDDGQGMCPRMSQQLTMSSWLILLMQLLDKAAAAFLAALTTLQVKVMLFRCGILLKAAVSGS